MTSPSPTELRKFGLVVGAGLGVISWLLLWRTAGIVLVVVAAGLVLFGLLAPRLLAPAQRGWMAFAHVLGWINTRLILGAVFYVGLAIVRFFLFVFRKDPMLRRPDAKVASYWNDVSQREFTPETMEHPF